MRGDLVYAQQNTSLLRPIMPKGLNALNSVPAIRTDTADDAKRLT